MTLAAAAFVLGTVGTIAFITWSTYQSARLLHTTRISTNLLLLPSESAAKIVLIALGVLLGSLSGASIQALGWARPTAALMLIGVAAGVALWAPLNAATWFAIGRWGTGIYSPLVLKNILPRNAAQWVLVPLAMIPAVVLEELLFRSLILGGMGQWVPTLLLAVAASALFGVSHIAQGRAAIVLVGALGFTLSLLFLWTRSLVSVATAHWVLNVLQLVTAAARREELSRLYPDVSEDASLKSVESE
jgi:membrane protease YdiL (CAAX protease family)